MPDMNRPMAESGDHGLHARRFGVLFDAHRRAVLGYALRRLEDPEDAADVVAETFLVAWRRLDDVPAGDDARPWLLGVARRVLANQRRGARRRVGLADRLRSELATQAVALDVPTGTDLAVRRALAALSDDDREVLLLAAWEGLTPSEIAIAAGVSAVTVRSRLHRARGRLRKELDALARDGLPGGAPDRSRPLDLAREHPR